LPNVDVTMSPSEVSPTPSRSAVTDSVVLVVEDQRDQRDLYRLFLESAGHEVILASNAEEAEALLDAGSQALPDVALLDIRLPGRSGLSLMDTLSRRRPTMPVIVATSSRDVEHAIFALRRGAVDYLIKPVLQEDLLRAVTRALDEAEMRRELTARRAMPDGGAVHTPGGVFASAPMRLVLSTLERVKDSSVPVLLTGDSGVGKETVARAIHQTSRRRSHPFVRVSCTRAATDQMDLELFGHERGAFAGADRRRTGALEAAGLGTVFLDDVAELDASTQSKLLRTIEDGEAPRAGGAPVGVGARIIAATSRDLAAEVEAGRFRRDLYHRLDAISIRLPSLRERTDEIPVLAEFLLERFAEKEGVPPKTLAPEALALLATHSWPGNVRELDNVLRRAALLAERTVLTPADLALGAQTTSPLPREPAREAYTGIARPSRPVEGVTVDRERMLKAIAETRGNVSAAARRLGIGRSTFYRYAKQFSLPL
jgi:DNA-binding NtrC family response regulator